jgi:hypothetical protein
MKDIISIIENGEWKKYPDIAKLSIEQIEIMKKTIIEMEYLGFKQLFIN